MGAGGIGRNGSAMSLWLPTAAERTVELYHGKKLIQPGLRGLLPGCLFAFPGPKAGKNQRAEFHDAQMVWNYPRDR